MKVLIHIQLLSDAIFGSGMSMPGGEDICILTDDDGFPYMKGSTFKGIFREELINYLDWCKKEPAEIEAAVTRLLGESGSNQKNEECKINFSDIRLDSRVIDAVRAEGASVEEVINMFSYVRDFTRLESGLAKEGSLRSGRCIKKGLNFYASCTCETGNEEDKKLVENVLKMIKWIGSMRNRGFGKVKVLVDEEG